MADLKKLIKKTRNVFMVVLAAATFYSALDALDKFMGRKIYDNAYKRLPNEQKIIVNSLIKQKVEPAQIEKEVVILNNINYSLSKLEEKIKQGDYSSALNIIINTNAFFKQIKYMDIRELEAKFLSLKKELNEAVNQKMNEKRDLGKRPWWD